ncbi:MAG: hypothetical protein KU28_03395 [Sulfurovum sp. PC08-66]|nr:MAG: hypothetical protein KU28_03395 [Sulfurovum sp. PC08-66]
MKLRYILATLLLISSLSWGDSTKYPFFGIVGLSSAINGENGGVVGIRYGQQSQDWRTSFTVETPYQEYQFISVAIDRTLLYSLTTSKLRIYGGLVGAAILFDKNDGSGDKSVGYGYGLGAGLMYYLTDNIDLDLGYRYMLVNDVDNLDEISSFGFALHYFF